MQLNFSDRDLCGGREQLSQFYKRWRNLKSLSTNPCFSFPSNFCGLEFEAPIVIAIPEQNDPLSEVIGLSGARCEATRCMETQGSWHFHFKAPGRIKFIALTKQACWLAIANTAPRRLKQGDVVMLNGTRCFSLATDLTLSPQPGSGFFTATAPSGEGEQLHIDFQAICGHIALDQRRGWLLANALPSVLVVEHNTVQAARMRWLLHVMVDESRASSPGGSLAREKLAQLLFVQLIRAHIDAGPPTHPGLIRALSDTRMAHALKLMHAKPTQVWRVQDLATRVRMSRTNFATQFAAMMGTPPLTYLASWRMQLADRALRSTTAPIGEVARSVGFESISAFSAAFRRQFGASPKQHRRTSSQLISSDPLPGM